MLHGLSKLGAFSVTAAALFLFLFVFTDYTDAVATTNSL
jgi:hypothetical protein